MCTVVAADAREPVVEQAAGEELLSHLCDDRPRLRIGLIGDPDPHVGELRSVGRDVLTLRMDGDPPPTAYLQVALIAELAIAR